MLINLFICGCANPEPEEYKEVERPMSTSSSPSSTPKRSRFCKSNNNNGRDKNPYATRGLDKFSALLADLDEKRRKIYAEKGSDPNFSLVRFVYKNTNDLVPVLVKLKDSNKLEPKTNNNNNNNNNNNKKKNNKITTSEITSISDRPQERFSMETPPEVKKQRSDPNDDRKMIKMRSFSLRPSFYLPVFVILILVLLAVFGRSVAILCTSIGWYVVPTLKENYSSKKKKKKDLVKRLSDKRVVSEGLLSSPRIKR